ncbi:tyrosine-type recombinase/integrase [Nonomuraea sp. NPDC052265]|uniref:tyrosine-type recombinase/integrase n=1 Tax=Nonomuraea sp. NPDC052265 TaxID=3364374 RepID=UPI0037C6EED9
MWLAYLAGLPPIRLHDLRHGAASLMLAAGVEMKVVQETLGHTSSAFTADTYTSVYPQPRRPPPCCSARKTRPKPASSSR